MKNTHSILSHLVNQPQFRILKKHNCYQKFIDLLPPKFSRAIAFVYIKNDILFIALSHPGYKMELNYNKDLLKSLLNMMGKHNSECSMLNVNSVIVFNSKFYVDKPKEITNTDPKYVESSTGYFNINTEDDKLREAFESIKKIIIRNKTS
jgi:hypothetical protein